MLELPTKRMIFFLLMALSPAVSCFTSPWKRKGSWAWDTIMLIEINKRRRVLEIMLVVCVSGGVQGGAKVFDFEEVGLH